MAEKTLSIHGLSTSNGASMIHSSSANAMHTDFKYLSIGILIGIGTTALLLTGMLLPPMMVSSQSTDTLTNTQKPFTATIQSTPTDYPPTNTYTPTPTLIRPSSTPTLTNTPTATPTVPSPTPTFSETIQGMLDGGYLSEVGPLNTRQMLQLYNTSVKFVRETSEESRILGEAINGKGYGAPSDICGPLSVAILQEAEIIDTNLDPHEFWLLNPDVWKDRRLLAKAFPPEQFDNFHIQIKLDDIDWHETPLYPGDFIYIYAGSGGNFEHMLVVNRVDSEGRAYAVTNHNTENGFIVSEVLLYHPENSDVGMFSIWTARSNAEKGATGFGGFELWRMRTP